jgi:hypothetical protein
MTKKTCKATAFTMVECLGKTSRRRPKGPWDDKTRTRLGCRAAVKKPYT